MALTLAEKRRFTRDLIKSVERKLVNEVLLKCPEEWDGIELRQLIADSFLARVSSVTFRAGLTPGDRKRRSDYKNEVLVRNLV